MLKKWFGKRKGTIATYVILGVFLVSVLIAAFLNLGSVFGVVGKTVNVFSPILYAILCVLIINPSVHIFRDRVFAFLEKGKKPHPLLRKILSVVCGYLLFLILFCAVLVIVIVPIFQSAEGLQSLVPSAVSSAVKWIDETVSKTPFLVAQEDAIMESINNSIFFSQNTIQNLLAGVVSSARAIFSEATSFVVGLIISVYIVLSLDYLRSIRDRIMKAFFTEQHDKDIRAAFRTAYRLFSDFITGRLLYSIVIGIVLFIILGLMKIPFYSVTSIGMGLLAFIPVSGTMLSFALGFTICLLFAPSMCLWCALAFFLVFLLGRLFLQPAMIRTDARCSVGLALISTTVMYAVFGPVGMILAVPTFLALKRGGAWLLDAIRNRAKNDETANVSEL